MKRLLSFIALSSLSFACKDVTTTKSDTSFAGGEHKVLGDDGYSAACLEFSGCPSAIQRADKKESFTYGELVAFSGDFYGTPLEIYNEKHSQSLLHPTSANTSRIKSLFKQEEEATRAQMANKDVSYPDFNLGFTFAFPKYLELATKNVNHFGWHNMKTYVDYHAQAMDFAVQAHFEKDLDKRDELFRRALFFNAFADHFLTDGFATGHIRNPRAQSIDWQEKNKYSKTAVDSLAKLVHDHDHLLSETHGPGLAVTNTRGDNWHTRCDGELFVLAQKRDSQIAIPVEAVSRSVKELLIAYKDGKIPDGLYTATELVPFLAAGEQPLIDIFKPDLPDSQIEAWLKSLGVIHFFRYFIGLNQTMTRTYFAALPRIMDTFRAEVTADAKDPNLQKRLPAAYIQGFQNVK